MTNLLFLLLKKKFVLLFQECVLGVHISAVSSEAKRGHHIPWGWSYRRLSAAMFALCQGSQCSHSRAVSVPAPMSYPSVEQLLLFADQELKPRTQLHHVMWSEPVWALGLACVTAVFLVSELQFSHLYFSGVVTQLPPQNEEKTTEMMLTSGRPFQPHSFNVFNAGCATVIGESRPCPLTQKPGHWWPSSPVSQTDPSALLRFCSLFCIFLL